MKSNTSYYFKKYLNQYEAHCQDLEGIINRTRSWTQPHSNSFVIVDFGFEKQNQRSKRFWSRFAKNCL